ncbi:mirror-image polydactyly gene 1 protein-like [Dendronephthya gigantea]|uniref:mirror-image polydactyly gene 1 protein-like n=1 Tax=Dendronephthya gigantea TaxID=151771 RepID=UPI0010697BE2|nr:mirror-image polydactyly gene 1 protein-like [Dendronephthya gigantea]
MDAIEEEDFHTDGKLSSARLRRSFPREKSQHEDMFEIKQNVTRTLKDARRKLNDLRSEVDRKDDMIRQARFEGTDRSMKKDESTRYSPGRSNYTFQDHNNNGRDSEELLHDEVKVLDSLNDRLMEKLARTESKLEEARLYQDEVSLEAEAKIAAKGAALVDKIYKAQKERDAAVLSRLRLANEERDEVLARMKRLEQEQQGFDSGVDSVYDDEDLDMNMKQLFKKLVASETGASIDRHGDMLVAKYKKHGKAKQIMAAEEIQALIDERDDALRKVETLEKEVESLQREKELMKHQFKFAEKTRIKSGQAQLMAAQKDKGDSQQRIKELEDEIQNYRVYYSLHRSLSQEQTLRGQFNATMDTFESKLNERENELAISQNNTKELVARLQDLAKEKEVLSSQLAEALSAQRKEKDKADKLERLVSVLRKRITNSGNQTL